MTSPYPDSDVPASSFALPDFSGPLTSASYGRPAYGSSGYGDYAQPTGTYGEPAPAQILPPPAPHGFATTTLVAPIRATAPVPAWIPAGEATPTMDLVEVAAPAVGRVEVATPKTAAVDRFDVGAILLAVLAILVAPMGIVLPPAFGVLAIVCGIVARRRAEPQAKLALTLATGATALGMLAAIIIDLL